MYETINTLKDTKKIRLELFQWETSQKGVFLKGKTIQKIVGMGKYDEGVRFIMENYSSPDRVKIGMKLIWNR